MVKRNVLNKLLLLRLIEIAGGIAGATRTQKLVFASESIGRKKHKYTFNYRFIRWHYGPYSEELRDDLLFLVELGLITDVDSVYKLTQRGLETISKANDIFSSLQTDLTLKEVLERYNSLRLSELLESVYDEFNIETAYRKSDIILEIEANVETGELV